MTGLMLAAASAEDASKKEKSASLPASRRYDPLIMPESQGATAAPVPQQRKEVSRETDKEAVSAAGPETQSGGRLIVPIEAEKDKDKKQSLWIYTLPEEQAVRRQQRMDESRKIEQWEESQKARQLPEWAIDPEFRKYLLLPDAGQNHPSIASGSSARLPDLDLFAPAGKAKEPGLPKAPDSSTHGSIFPGGSSLTSGKEPSKKKEEADDIVRKDAEFDPLYQSNQKQKRIEDFYDGLNKPVEVEQSSDRYHKPQKPQ